MDFNTILVITVDGGLVLFLLYALYTIQSLNYTSRGIKKDLEVPAQEPVVTPLRGAVEEYEIPKVRSRELFELEQAEPAPREYRLSEVKPEPVEPAPREFTRPAFEPRPEEPTPIEYGLPVFEPEATRVQARKDEVLKEKKREREH